jgi:hypothetical protein
VTCTPAPPAPPSFTVIINGNTSTVPINVPVGSHCTVTEGAMPPLPPGCHWLPPIYAPAGVTIATGSNQETVTNGYVCREVCPPPQVANVDGICVCPPPMVPGAVPGSCVCPDHMSLEGGKCVKKIVCDPPLIPNTAGTQCVCRDGFVRRGGECVEVKQPKHQQTCKRGFVQSGDMCVRRKTEPKDDKSRDRPDFEIPGGLPGLGGRGGLGGGGGGGMSPGRR